MGGLHYVPGLPYSTESPCVQVVETAHEVGLRTTSTIMVRLPRAHIAASQIPRPVLNQLPCGAECCYLPVLPDIL